MVDPHHPLAALREQTARLGVLTEITLPALVPDDVVLLLHLLSDECDTGALAAQLYRETEGHPYFLAEVLRTFVQEQLVTSGRGRPVVRDRHGGSPPGPRLVPPCQRARGGAGPPGSAGAG